MWNETETQCYEADLENLDLFTSRFGAMFADALGPLLPLYKNPAVNDLLCNHDGCTFIVDKKGKRQVEVITSDAQRLSILKMAASWSNQEFHARRPRLNVSLPDGSRLYGTRPPIAPAPLFSLRKMIPLPKSFDDYEKDGTMTKAQGQLIRDAIQHRRNAVIFGATGSGKTTLGNAFVQEMAATGDRIAIIEEDVRELQCQGGDIVRLCTRHDELTEIGVHDLLRDALRVRPDRVVLGEARGGEVFPLCKMWLSGHAGGFCTLHADSPEDTLIRLQLLAKEATDIDVREYIARTVDLLVHVVVSRDGKRQVQSIHELTGIRQGQFQLRQVG